MSKKIGILGSGAVAKSLAAGFVKHGYEVKLGTRDMTKLKDWLSNGGRDVLTGTFADAAEYGEILVLAVKGTAAKTVLQMAEGYLSGKTIIDATNPIDPSPPVNGVLRFFTSSNHSLMEELQDACPDAHFVKAFSSVGAAQMVNPVFDVRPTMFICGNIDTAKAQVTEILNVFGWDSEDMGKATAARAIEPLAVLWCIPGFLRNEWGHAFKLLK